MENNDMFYALFFSWPKVVISGSRKIKQVFQSNT